MGFRNEIIYHSPKIMTTMIVILHTNGISKCDRCRKSMYEIHWVYESYTWLCDECDPYILTCWIQVPCILYLYRYIVDIEYARSFLTKQENEGSWHSSIKEHIWMCKL